MSVVTACSSCNTRLRLPDNLPATARAVRCPRCGASVPVPTPLTAAPPAPIPVPAPAPVPAALSCPHCRTEVACDSRLAGQLVACPLCQGQFRMPATAAAVQSRPPAPVPAPATVGAPARELRRREAPLRSPSRRGLRIGVLSAVAGVLGVVFLLLLVLPSSGASGLADEGQYFPEDTRIIVSLDVRGMLRSAVGQKLQASRLFREFEQQFAGKNGGDDPSKVLERLTGLSLSDLGRITVAFPLNFPDPGRGGPRQEPPDVVIVIKTANAARFNPQGFGGPPPVFREQTVGRYTVKHADGFGFCIADGGTIVLGPTNTLMRILARGAPAPLAPGMRDALKQADFSSALTVAVDVSALKGRERDVVDQAFGKNMPPEGAKMRDAMEGVVVQVRADNHLNLRFALLCKDAAKANEIKDMLNGKLDEGRKQMAAAGDAPAEILKLFESLRFTSSNNAVRIGVRIDLDGILRMAEAQMDQERLRQQQWQQQFQQGMKKRW